MTESDGTNSKNNFSVTDIEKLAGLSRLALTPDEKESFTKDIGSILSYVGQIQEISAESGTGRSMDPASYPNRNIMRGDISSSEIGNKLNPDSSILVNSAPMHEDGLIKVKKILGGSQ